MLFNFITEELIKWLMSEFCYESPLSQILRNVKWEFFQEWGPRWLFLKEFQSFCKEFRQIGWRLIRLLICWWIANFTLFEWILNFSELETLLKSDPGLMALVDSSFSIMIFHSNTISFVWVNFAISYTFWNGKIVSRVVRIA